MHCTGRTSFPSKACRYGFIQDASLLAIVVLRFWVDTVIMDISNVRSRLAERDVLVPVMAGSFLVYLACLVLYRLYLSPIAQVPGSKLAAFTGWYEAYLDVFKGGQFTFQIGRWHQQYGRSFWQLTRFA